MNRRNFLISSSLLVPTLSAHALPLQVAGGARKSGLNDIARRKGLFFGSAVNVSELTNDAQAKAIIDDCGIITAQRAQKWPIMWQYQDHETPEEADLVAQFSFQHGLLLRGHALIYDAFMPDWVKALDKTAMRRAFDRRISYAASRWKGKVHSWDVVNEAIEPNDHLANGLRNSLFMKALGPSYISDAFFRAKECDPSALLCYNDYNLDSTASFADRRRRTVLKLLESLKKRGAPVEALGVQSHLKSQLKYDDRIWRDFLKEVADMGLKIIVSELDVNDRYFSEDIARRDAQVASMTSRYLNVTLDEPKVIGIVSWGLNDGQSWMAARQRKGDPGFIRADGAVPRPHPLSSSLEKKPMWYAIADALRAAPDRS
ncbi:endo-1,4-beta-xylanase [Stenotrophomonas maltophilia group sp. Smal35]|uniref:endo-1,4-beta-xylanase n=1 Tax=Stenotrophomonas maltophilia group sp. Smal35 TaxID=3377163 RepID=UPI002553B8AD|nr:endo-1,4-beta-xylanase [Stenotrophomonas maltophilia]